MYDKWQTKRMREKWCNTVAHLADETLGTKNMPRRLTIYLAAPPGDGLRSAREHFHDYVKPILVAAAMDWDVVEGRKEGDVRHKTAEKIRRRRKRNGEGAPLTGEEAEKEAASAEGVRARSGVEDFPGVAGDIVIGRHTWIEYLRGLHEGYLGPADAPPAPEPAATADEPIAAHNPGHSSIGDAAVKAATNIVVPDANNVSSLESLVGDSAQSADASETTDKGSEDASQKEEKKEEKPAEEKPQRRFPESYILPEAYAAATASPSLPEIIGPSVGVRFPHLLGIRNTPFRLYRFFTRRRLADDVGRQVASAVLGWHRPYGTQSVVDANSASDAVVDVPEQKQVLAFEEKDWWKTVRREREEHEEDVWIQPIAFDERITSRMRAFELRAGDEERAKRFAAGTEKLKKHDDEES